MMKYIVSREILPKNEKQIWNPIYSSKIQEKPFYNFHHQFNSYLSLEKMKIIYLA